MSVLEETTITRASSEWWKRPDDERYLTLEGSTAPRSRRRR